MHSPETQVRKITEACDMDTTTKRHITNDELKALNIRLWKEWTLKATEVNCCKLCSSVVDDATAGQFLKYVQGYEATPEIIGLIARIARGEYTPPGLDCTLRGKPQKNFLMYKIEPLPHPSGNAYYEFLVEYDRMEPNVGIYLGCKCVTSEAADHLDMMAICAKEWDELRFHICTVLNNSFPEKEFRHRFRITNNGENKTFWPSWIGLYDDEDMEFALTVLRIIRKAYEQYFNGTLKECRHLKPIPYRHIDASFTESAFTRLTEAIGRSYRRDKALAATNLFSKFILNASGRGIFIADPSYDLAWRYMGHPTLGLNGSDIEFSTLMRILTLEIGYRLNIKDLQKPVKTPWELIRKVFLDSEGIAFKDGMRTQWQNALSDTLSACRRAVGTCLD